MPKDTLAGYNGEIPNNAILEIENELYRVYSGEISLVLFIRDGHLSRFETRARHCTYSNNGFSGRFPLKAFMLLEKKVSGFFYGYVEICLVIVDGCFQDFTVNITRSFIPETVNSGKS